MKTRWKLGFNFFMLITALVLNYILLRSPIIHFKNIPIHTVLGYFIFYFSITCLALIIKFSYSKRRRMGDKKNNVHFGIENIANFLIGLVGVLTLFSLFGVNFMEIITSITIVAAAIALITKDFIADFLSGIYLSFSNAFEINDLVKLDNQKGKVVEITMLKTKILNDDDDIVIIPNSKVHYNDIINYTKRDPRRIDIDFELDSRYVKQLDELEKELIQALEPVKTKVEDGNFVLKVEEMKMEYMELKFQLTLIPLEMDEHKKIRRRAKRLIFNCLAAKYS